MLTNNKQFKVNVIKELKIQFRLDFNFIQFKLKRENFKSFKKLILLLDSFKFFLLI